MRTQTIKVRTGLQSTGHKGYMIGVPWQIAEALPDGVEFKAELTEDGILFRPVIDTVTVPRWVQKVAR